MVFLVFFIILHLLKSKVFVKCMCVCVCVSVVPGYLSVCWGCCRVNIGQTSFLLFAFDCWIKCLFSPCFLLMITLYYTSNALYTKPNIWEGNHYLINFNFLCSRLNNSTNFGAAHISASPSGLFAYCTLRGKGGNIGGKVYPMNLMWVWDKLKLISYHFKYVAFRHFKAKI